MPKATLSDLSGEQTPLKTGKRGTCSGIYRTHFNELRTNVLVEPKSYTSGSLEQINNMFLRREGRELRASRKDKAFS
jgi:hypothetical protein